MNDAARTLPPEALDPWVQTLAHELGVTAADVPVSLVLDLARDVATGVARPAAPVSAFVAGLVAGRRGGSAGDIDAVVAQITALALAWPDAKHTAS